LSGFTGAEFEARTPNTTTAVFRVNQAGDITIIKGFNYLWPNSQPFPTSGNMKVLGYQTTSGTPQLAWLDPPTGTGSGVTGGGTLNYLPKWNTSTTPGQLVNSVAYDDGGSNFQLQTQQFAVLRPDAYAGPVICVYNQAGTIQQFTVNNIGELRTINQLGYHWPGPGAQGTNGQVLTVQSVLSGVATLAWVTPPGGSGVGSASRTLNALTRWSNTTAPGTITDAGVSDDGATVSTSRPVLIAAPTTLNPLLTLQNNAVEKFRITAQGTIVAQQAGTLFGVNTILTGSTTLTPQHRTVIADTLSGSITITLPAVSGCRGQIYDIIGYRYLKAADPAGGGATGSTNPVRIQVTAGDALNAWATPGTAGNGGASWDMGNVGQKRAVKLIADATDNVWWLVPYNI
jgi:hypothetical protein